MFDRQQQEQGWEARLIDIIRVTESKYIHKSKRVKCFPHCDIAALSEEAVFAARPTLGDCSLRATLLTDSRCRSCTCCDRVRGETNRLPIAYYECGLAAYPSTCDALPLKRSWRKGMKSG